MSGLFDSEVDGLNERGVISFRPECGVSCTACDHCQSPKLKLIAKKKHGYMFIAGEPTTSQDNSRKIWTGSYKNVLLPLMEKYKVDMDKVSFAFATACHGTNISSLDGVKYDTALASCRETLMETIEEADPDVLIPMDNAAWDALTADHLTGRIESTTFSADYVYNLIPDQTIGRWLAPILSPQYLYRIMSDRKSQDEYEFYARKTRKFLKHVFNADLSDFPCISTPVTKCDNLEMAKFALQDILVSKPSLLSFDFETEGLKLEREDMDIVCVGIAYDNTVLSMPFYKDQSFRDLFKQVMVDPDIGKIAHHAKYEARCCLNKLGVCPEPWVWDSMYGARVLNNRIKCGLKPQTYINFGVAGYDSIECYFKAESKEEEEKYGENRRNRLMAAFENDSSVRSKALQYVGEDALYTLMLAKKQMELVEKDEHLKKGEELFRSFINPLVRAEVRGLVVDKQRTMANIEKCNELLTEIEEKIYSDELVTSLWNEEEQGHKFDYNKSSDLGKLLYDLTGQEKQYTDKGGLLLSADALSKMPYPVTDLIVEARQTLKLRDTYLVNIYKEAVLDKDGDYKLHSTFNLHVADTFRSSSSGGLNTQNLPSRDDRAVKLIKSCIVPQKGRRIIGFDYRALEAAIGACIHKDKNMADFITGGGDMHRKTLLDMFRLTETTVKDLPEKTYKQARNFSKKANFSSFYGAAYKSVASKAWKDANYLPEIMAHLKSVKLGSYDTFLEHMKNVCERLWTVQFPVYGAWRKEQYEFYLKHGYVELIDGFRCWGPLTSMQASNSPIQGPASHCLLWAFKQIDQELAERKLQTYLINEIHDACYISEVPEEHEEVIPIIRKWMIEELPNKFSWVTIPMAVEGEGTAVREEGGNWADTVLDLGYI